MDILPLLRNLIDGKFPQREDSLGYISPSTLAAGCLLRVARELLGMPKAEPTVRQKRLRDAGSSAHSRILGYFSPISLAQEVPFLVEEHRIKGRCDALLYVPSGFSQEAQGFYALEIKTLGTWEYGTIEEEGKPRLDHLRQCLIYQWGINRYYGIPIRAGIIYYENRDTLDYMLFLVPFEEGELLPLLELVKLTLLYVERGELPQSEEYRLPLDHWGHRYCPYLPLCPYGQEAVKKKREVPEEIVAKIIAERIVRKQHKPKPKVRTLEELIEELGWE